MPERPKGLDEISGFFQGIADHLMLVWRLWNDPRVPFPLKLLPFTSLLYLISPLDLPTPIDDVGVIWLATYLFIEMCPPDLVAEHRAEVEKTVVGWWGKDTAAEEEIDPDKVVDADYEEMPPEE